LQRFPESPNALGPTSTTALHHAARELVDNLPARLQSALLF
jgi:hypothetical protein